MLVKEIPNGGIVWKGDTVLGIKGSTLPPIFDECKARAVGGNYFDYELLPQEYTDEQKAFIEQARKEWEMEDDEEYVDDINKTAIDIADGLFDLPDDGLPF